MLSFRAFLLVIFLPAIGCEFEPGPGNNITPKEDPDPIQKPSSRDGSVAAPSDSGVNNPLQDSGSDGPFGRKDAGPFVLDGGAFFRDSGAPQHGAGAAMVSAAIPPLEEGYPLVSGR